MIERRTLSISLPPELHDFVSGLVKTGNYGSASEVMRAGLRLLRQDEAHNPIAPVPHAKKLGGPQQ